MNFINEPEQEPVRADTPLGLYFIDVPAIENSGP